MGCFEVLAHKLQVEVIYEHVEGAEAGVGSVEIHDIVDIDM